MLKNFVQMIFLKCFPSQFSVKDVNLIKNPIHYKYENNIYLIILQSLLFSN